VYTTLYRVIPSRISDLEDEDEDEQVEDHKWK